MLLARLSVLVICSAFLSAQTDPAVQAARRYRQAHEREIVSSYLDLLAIPNVAADPANLRRNADVIAQALQNAVSPQSCWSTKALPRSCLENSGPRCDPHPSVLCAL
jgi:hypothetical protein